MNAEAKKVQETVVTQLAPRRLQLAEHARNVHYVTPEPGTPIDALLDPAYWAHCSRLFQKRDHIEVNAEDGAYFAELMVLETGHLYAKVALMRKVEFKANTVEADGLDGYDFKHSGSKQEWCVIRKSDKKVLIEGRLTKESAIDWLKDHLKP
jgi:hypothetical protein